MVRLTHKWISIIPLWARPQWPRVQYKQTLPSVLVVCLFLNSCLTAPPYWKRQLRPVWEYSLTLWVCPAGKPFHQQMSRHSKSSKCPQSSIQPGSCLQLLEVYILATSKVISGWAPTCDSAHSWWLSCAATLGDQAISTMTWYPTQ